MNIGHSGARRLIEKEKKQKENLLRYTASILILFTTNDEKYKKKGKICIFNRVIMVSIQNPGRWPSTINCTLKK